MLTAWKQRRADASRRAFLARVHDINDPLLRQRIVSIAEQGIALAEPDRVSVDVGLGTEHTCVWWTWKQEGDTSVQRGIHPDWTDWTIGIEDDRNPDAGPWVFVTTQPDVGFTVRWMPGQGFDSAEVFVDWFERGADLR